MECAMQVAGAHSRTPPHGTQTRPPQGGCTPIFYPCQMAHHTFPTPPAANVSDACFGKRSANFRRRVVRKLGVIAICSIAMKTNLKTSKRTNEQPKKIFQSTVRKLHPVAISPTEMKTSFRTTETGSERTSQQSEKSFGLAVRKLIPAAISPVMKANTQVGEQNSQERLGQISGADARTTGSVSSVESDGRSMTLCSGSANEHQDHQQASNGNSRKSLKEGNTMNTALDTLKTGSVHGDNESRWSMALRSCSADERQGHNQINLRQQAAADAEVSELV